jgi:hypothetical protein
VPELFHNALAGWGGLRRTEAARCVAVLLEWSQEEPLVRRGFRQFERTLTAHGARAIRVPLASEDRLEAILRGVALGDQVSLRFADRRKVDPCAIDDIERMRATLGSTAGPGG